MDNSVKRQIQDYFNGSLPPGQEAELLEWIKQNDRNRKEFLEFKYQLEPDEINHPLLYSSFAELKSRLLINQAFSTSGRSTRKLFWLSVFKISAILLVGLLLGFYAKNIINARNIQDNQVVWFETHVPRGAKSQIVLPDSSRIWINSETTISYPSNFMHGNREVKLNGEAYFEVAKLSDKPFLVKTQSYDVKVLGTKFNVMAYSDFKRTETSLIEGKIEIQVGDKNIPVVPGEIFTYANNNYTIKKAKADQASEWKNNIFDFDYITFKELIYRIERWYDVEIKVQNNELNDISYSGIFKNAETIEQVLETIQLTLPIKCSKVGFRKFKIEKR